MLSFPSINTDKDGFGDQPAKPGYTEPPGNPIGIYVKCALTLFLQKLSDHMVDHLPATQYKCYKCDLRFPTNNDLSIHIRNNHQPHLEDNSMNPLSQQKCPRFACYICNELFPQQCDLGNHLKIVHTKGTVFWCDVCNNCFESTAAIDMHVVLCHGQKEVTISQFRRDTCECSFHDEFNLAAHMKTHDEPGHTNGEECIRQTGGNDSIEDNTFTSIQDKVSVSQNTSCTRSNCPLPLRYSMNKTKQVATLAKQWWQFSLGTWWQFC